MRTSLRVFILRVFRLRIFASLSVALLAIPTHAQTPSPKPWPIRAVIVTTFEIGKDTGDMAGEFQFWVEREHLDQTLDFPGGPITGPGAPGSQPTPHPIRTNADHTILGIVAGTTLVNATASMMALGLDPRFDLTHAYILINGIAGVDPQVASIGSAAWANFVVGDVSRYIDSHDSPKEWPYGFLPIGAKAPNPSDLSQAEWFGTNLYPLNQKLTAWAYAQTKDLKLPDNPETASARAGWEGFPNAQKPAFVLIGDSFASDFFWHGNTSTQFARDWVRIYTGGKGIFAMTEMEDSGFMNAIDRLNNMHRVDRNRVMVLRTASNYTEPRPNHAAIESLTASHLGKLAFETAWIVGSTALHQILTHWDTTYTTIPGN